jgi:RNA polymerase sigma-70 factor (ECF subfamily)
MLLVGSGQLVCAGGEKIEIFREQISPLPGNTLMDDPPNAPATRKTLLLGIRDPANTEAWQTFVELYTPLIYHFCVRRGLQEADSQDVLQNVFLSVQRDIAGFDYDPERGLFRNWLITLLLRQINRYQSQIDQGTRGIGGGVGDRLADQLETDEEDTWNQAFCDRVCKLAIDRIRQEFSPEVFQAFEEVWSFGRKPAEVAQELNQSAGWVYQAKYRVLKRLMQEIEFLGGDRLCQFPE